MPIPSSITDLSTTPAANSPSGSENPIEGDNHLRSAYSFIRQLYDGITASGNAQAAQLADTTGTANGDALVGVLRTATGAVATTQHQINEKRKFDVAIDFGVSGSSNQADTRAAMQLGITATGNLGNGGVCEVPGYLNAGYEVGDDSTHPDFTGITKPVILWDYSYGNSYAGYPTAYDGAQVRLWMHTPQTTSPGQHDGNGFKLYGFWNPYFALVVTNPLDGARAATDNQRAAYHVFSQDEASMRIGQGTLDSATATKEELSNIVWEVFPLTGDTLAGNWYPFLGERKTRRMGYGPGSNAPIAHHDFFPGNPTDTTVPVLLARTSASTSGVEVQSSSGTGSRSYLRNVSGVTEIGTTTGGTSIKQRQSDAFLEFGTGSSYTYHFNFQASRASNWIQFVNNTNATDGFVSRFQSTSTQAATWDFLGCYANAGADARAFIRGTGNIVNANNSYGAISDEKLKQDIQDAGSAWDDFKAYRFRKYRFKGDPTGPLQLGVIAQEIEQVSPGLVNETPDFEIGEDGERHLTGTSTKEVKYSVLYAKACVVIQELMARVEALEKR